LTKMLNKPIVAEDIENRIASKHIAKKVVVFETLGSTSEFAKRLAQNGERYGTLILTNEQTDGRGRQGRRWYAPANSGLWFSIILKPTQPTDKFGIVSLLAAVALAKTIERTTSLSPALKWPNDVLINSKKVSGILLEGQFSNNRHTALVLGIGINVNQKQTDFPEEIRQTATSLREQTKHAIDRVSLLIEFLHNLEYFYLKFNDGNSRLIINAWKKRCPFLGKNISVKQNKDDIVGRFENLDEYGRMALRLHNGQIKYLSAGELNLIQREEQCCS